MENIEPGSGWYFNPSDWAKGRNPFHSFPHPEREKEMPDQAEKFQAFQVVVFNADDGTVYVEDVVTAKNSQAAQVHVIRNLDSEAPDDVEVVVRPL